MKYEEVILLVEGNKLNRLEKYHSKNGYIIVSAQIIKIKIF